MGRQSRGTCLSRTASSEEWSRAILLPPPFDPWPRIPPLHIVPGDSRLSRYAVRVECVPNTNHDPVGVAARECVHRRAALSAEEQADVLPVVALVDVVRVPLVEVLRRPVL